MTQERHELVDQGPKVGILDLKVDTVDQADQSLKTQNVDMKIPDNQTPIAGVADQEVEE